MKAYFVFLMEETGPEHEMEIVSERFLKAFNSKEKAISYVEKYANGKIDPERGMLILSKSRFKVLGEKHERIKYLSIAKIEIE